MCLLKLLESESVVVEPVEEVDGHGGGLLGPEERAVRTVSIWFMRPEVPAAVAPYDVAMLLGAHSLERTDCPLVVPDREFVAARQRTVLDQEATDVVRAIGAPGSWSSISCVIVGATASSLRKVVTWGCLIQVTPLLDRFIDFSAAATGTSSAAITPVPG